MASSAVSSILNLFGFGLGYVYLGQMRNGLSFVGAMVCVFAIAGWTGLVFHPVGIYVIAAASLLVGLTPFVHCPILARSGRANLVRRYRIWWVYLIWIAVSWILSHLFFEYRSVAFGYDLFHLPARSMSPTLQLGDHITVDTWSHRTGEPKHGDLYAFELNDDYGTKYVKRVVGLPGDTLELRDTTLIRNGQTVSEPYLTTSDPGRGFGPVTLYPDQYFFLGDNRARSKDSRYIGAISRDQLHGVVRLRWFAIDGGVGWDRFPHVFNRE